MKKNRGKVRKRWKIQEKAKGRTNFFICDRGISIMAEGNKINPFRMAMKQIETSAKYLNLDPGLLEKLKNTKRELIVHFPVKTDNGWLKPQNLEESIQRQMIIAKLALQIAN